MAIANANATYVGTQSVPAYTGQILATGGSDQTELAYKGKATITLDGATTSATVNFIDGTQTLPFTPSEVIATVTGGTQTAAAYVGVVVSAITNTGFTVLLSGAGTSANTLTIAFIAMK